MDQNDELFWVHLIRALAVFFVVLLHSAAQVLQLDVPFGSTNWWAGNVIDSAMRFCVPLLFMISGFLLVGKQESLGVFFRKRLSKVTIPLLFWSGFYVLWIVFVEMDNPSPIAPFSQQIGEAVISMFPFSLVGLFVAPAYYHLWFMYALIGLYLSLPLLRVLVQNAQRSLLKYFVVLWAIGTYFWPLLTKAGMYVSVELGMVTGNIGFLVIGYLLGSADMNKHGSVKRLLIYGSLFVIGVFITAYGTFLISSESNFDQTFYGNMPNSLLMSIPGFLLLRYLGERQLFNHRIWLRNSVIVMSRCAFGIYLFHAWLLYVLHKGLLGFQLDAAQGNALIYIPLTTIVTYLLSLFVVYLMRKLSWTRAVVG